jgi:hypothetical protein
MQDVNEQLREAIDQRDIPSIRNILTTSMVQDPGFANGVFEGRLRKVLESGISKEEIFEPFTGEEITGNRALWTKDYYAKARTDFRYNFSAERLEHLRRVGQKLYPAAPEEAAKKKYGDELPAGNRAPHGKDAGFPGWLIPAGIAAAIALLLWAIFRRK